MFQTKKAKQLDSLLLLSYTSFSSPSFLWFSQPWQREFSESLSHGNERRSTLSISSGNRKPSRHCFESKKIDILLNVGSMETTSALVAAHHCIEPTCVACNSARQKPEAKLKELEVLPDITVENYDHVLNLNKTWAAELYANYSSMKAEDAEWHKARSKMEAFWNELVDVKEITVESYDHIQNLNRLLNDGPAWRGNTIYIYDRPGSNLFTVAAEDIQGYRQRGLRVEIVSARQEHAVSSSSKKGKAKRK